MNKQLLFLLQIGAQNGVGLDLFAVFLPYRKLIMLGPIPVTPMPLNYIQLGYLTSVVVSVLSAIVIPNGNSKSDHLSFCSYKMKEKLQE